MGKEESDNESRNPYRDLVSAVNLSTAYCGENGPKYVA